MTRLADLWTSFRVGLRPRGILALASPLLANPACVLLVDVDALSEGCRDDEKECGGECVSTSDPQFGCGGQTCQPCALPNATSACSPEGECFVASCLDTHDDCNRASNDGCEVNTATDPLHCGSCNAEACVVPGAIAACANGQCAIRKCQEGFKDCNRVSRDGCEQEVLENDDHCGQCRSACDAGASCVMGRCSVP